MFGIGFRVRGVGFGQLIIVYIISRSEPLGVFFKKNFLEFIVASIPLQNPSAVIEGSASTSLKSF